MASRPHSDAPSEDPSEYTTPLQTPQASRPFLAPPPLPAASLPDTPRDSFLPNTAADSSVDSPSNSTPFLHPATTSDGPSEKYPAASRRPFWRRPLVWLLAFAVLTIVVLAVVLPVYFAVVRPRNRSQAAGASSSGNSGSPTGATTGGNGSVVRMANGQEFVYTNPFGGFWVSDPNDPFNLNAQPNSWTPPLNTSWTWGKDRVYGVNLGGLFVLEPFIAPSLFQKYPGTVDEWTLSEAMAADTSAGGGLQAQLEAHYQTFITEEDIAQIAGAGLNWLRLPIPYWAIETRDGEPFLARVCWKYILQVFEWARKYGLRIYLDLHTVPGSQNGYNHSGKLGQVNFMSGLMGLANAQRTLSYIRIITEFISQPEYKDVIPVFGIVNEVLVSAVGKDSITSFYLQAHDMIRNITGYGEGNGPFITVHDGFLGTANWTGFLPGTDRVILDTHPYFAFDGQPNDAPIATSEEGKLVADGASGGPWPLQACSAWSDSISTSSVAFGVTVAGEFSNGFNNCGLYVLGVGNNPDRDCSVFNDWQNWNDTMRGGFREYTLASMDATQDWYFWTWKIGNSSTSGTVEAPLWSYKLGLDNGWITNDPRDSIGKCASLVSGASTTALSTYTYSAWQTGAASTAAPASLSASFPWPPTSLSAVGPEVYPALIPTYTATGAISTLPMPSVTKGVKEGDGWFDKADTTGVFVAVSGCPYPDAWNSSGAVTPTAACPAATGVQSRRAQARAFVPTAVPVV
ncbi:glycoside hydrolase superfamily [Amylostereum chailletii]|nr:glycoside hydrolase superfamily [Amylostereum chailletii]